MTHHCDLCNELGCEGDCEEYSSSLQASIDTKLLIQKLSRCDMPELSEQVRFMFERLLWGRLHYVARVAKESGRLAEREDAVRYLHEQCPDKGESSCNKHVMICAACALADEIKAGDHVR